MAKPTRRVIGRLLPNQQVEIEEAFNQWMLSQDTVHDRLGLIPATIAPSRVARILNDASLGNMGEYYELLEKMRGTDTRYGGLTSQVLSAVASLPLKVEPAEGMTPGEQELAQEYADIISEQFAQPDFDTHSITKFFGEAHFDGVALAELKYVIKDFPFRKRIALIEEVRPIANQKLRWQTNELDENYGELLLRTRTNGVGVPVKDLRREKIAWLKTSFRRARYDVSGIGRLCLGWWITKIWTQLWMTEFAETYGMPLRIGRYPDGASKGSRKVLETFLKMLGKSGYGLFPQGMEVQLLNANQTASIDTYERIIKMANDEIAVAVVGQVQTVGDRRQGSYAQTEVLDGIRMDIVRDVAKLVSKGYEQLARNLIVTNYGEDNANLRLLPRIMPLIVDPDDNTKKVKTFGSAKKLGIALPVHHVYEELGIPMPKEGEIVILGNERTTFTQDLLENGEINSQTAEALVQQRGSEGDGDSDGEGDGEDDQAEDA